jgi:hypothetical protein
MEKLNLRQVTLVYEELNVLFSLFRAWGFTVKSRKNKGKIEVVLTETLLSKNLYNYGKNDPFKAPKIKDIKSIKNQRPIFLL